MTRPRFESLVTGVTLMSVEADRRALEQLIVELLQHRADGDAMTPVEVAKAASPEGWRLLMAAVRLAACRLASLQVIDIIQDGRVIGAETTWRGPVRFQRGPRWHSHSELNVA